VSWRWVVSDVLYAVHDRQLTEHGGGEGVRDRGLIDSALARPQNLAAYDTPDAAAITASYAFGLCRNHGFVDGNKRTAWVIARVFLADNGLGISFDKFEAIRLMEGVAAGRLEEIEIASWFRERIVRTAK